MKDERYYYVMLVHPPYFQDRDPPPATGPQMGAMDPKFLKVDYLPIVIDDHPLDWLARTHEHEDWANPLREYHILCWTEISKEHYDRLVPFYALLKKEIPR